ncbi:MAG: nucleotidyltransferase domain-containing protein [Chloroflexi bacterium]|nr:nucleotidyltransferase domain-containing protein [Chloroflexota bacterium]
MAREKALTQAELRARLQVFKEQRGPEFHLTALGYFGSYARREAHPESDVDIVFETTHPNLWMTSIMKQDLEEWLERPVDLIRLHRYMPPAFRARLEREAVYV